MKSATLLLLLLALISIGLAVYEFIQVSSLCISSISESFSDGSGLVSADCGGERSYAKVWFYAVASVISFIIFIFIKVKSKKNVLEKSSVVK